MTRSCAMPGSLLVAFTLVSMLVCVGCGKNDNGGGPLIIDASGGEGGRSGGVGGNSGGLNVRIYGDAGSSIEVREDDSVDASFEATPPELVLISRGSNGLIVSETTIVELYSVSAPPLDVPYAVEGFDTLFISDGDGIVADEPPVTGLEISPGATLTLPLNTGGVTAEYAFTHDVANFGTLTVADASAASRGDLDLEIGGRYLGDGDIETFGTAPGMHGGDISIVALSDSFNAGDWSTDGADAAGADAGDGGDIRFALMGDALAGAIENTGDMTASGGDVSSGAGNGGDGGEIEIQSYRDLLNAGRMESTGGRGTLGGGDGGDIALAAGYRGDLLSSGEIESDGGPGSSTEGGDGGDIELMAHGGDIASSGRVSATGGDCTATGGEGGNAGGFFARTTSSDDAYESTTFNTPAGDIWLSGGLAHTGGSATASFGEGGDGGHILISLDNSDSIGDQAIHLLGIKRIDDVGGDGDLEGGSASSIDFNAAWATTVSTSSIVVEPPIDSSGGDADPGTSGSEGGDGDNIFFDAATISYGKATADGGTGETPGTPGSITPET